MISVVVTQIKLLRAVLANIAPAWKKVFTGKRSSLFPLSRSMTKHKKFYNVDTGWHLWTETEKRR